MIEPMSSFMEVKNLKASEVAACKHLHGVGCSERSEALKNSISKNGWKKWSSLAAVEQDIQLLTGAHRQNAIRSIIKEDPAKLSDCQISTAILKEKKLLELYDLVGFRTLVRLVIDRFQELRIPVEQKAVGYTLRKIFVLPELYRTSLQLFERALCDTFPDLDDIQFDYEIFCHEYADRTASHPWEIAMSIYFGCAMQDKRILECGARNSFFGSYVSKYAKSVCISDGFIKWEEFGFEDVWLDLWKRASVIPEVVETRKENMQGLSFPDGEFDVVASYSAIEHSEDDTKSVQELARVTKPGGMVIISTDFAPIFDPTPHVRKYTLGQFHKRIVEPSGLKMDSQFNLALPTEFKDSYTPGIIFLKKI